MPPSESEVPAPEARLPESPRTAAADPGRARALAGMALALVLATPGVITWLVTRPIPTPPLEMPALALAPHDVAAQLAEDARRAREAPSSPAAEARAAAYREILLAELDRADRPALAEQRHARLAAALSAVVEEHGQPAREATRAADLERAMSALRGEVPGIDRQATLGAFVETLEHYGMARESRQRAPQLVVRTAFKARWNAAHGRDLTEGFSPIERQAYWGWLGLEADAAPAERRLEGLARYAEAGGAHAAEARAVLLLEQGRRDEAAEAFDEAHRARPSARLRNLALGARAE